MPRHAVASLTYSLSRLFRTLIPTDLMDPSTDCYLVNRRREMNHTNRLFRTGVRAGADWQL